MKNKWKFWDVIKKKTILVLFITSVITFFMVKVIDIILNWYLNKDTLAYGVRYNYTISIFSPIIGILVFVLVTNIVKAFLNGRSSGHHWNFTWKDVFRERESFALLLIITFGGYCLGYSVIEKVSSLSSNYGISSFANISTDVIVVVSLIIGVFLVVVLQNTLVVWLTQTEKGKRTLCFLTFICGILTFLVMCGVDYIWTPADEIATALQDDYAMGLIIPIDLNTALFGMITLWLWNKARKYVTCHRERANSGLIIAIIGVIISFTPLQMIIQIFLITLTKGASVLAT